MTRPIPRHMVANSAAAPLQFRFPHIRHRNVSRKDDPDPSKAPAPSTKERMRDLSVPHLRKKDETVYDAVVLSSGGVRGIAHLGALDLLQRQHPDAIRSARYFVGSSAGAVVATLLATGINPRDAMDALIIPFRYKKDIRLHLMSTLFGIESGNSLEEFLGTVVDKAVTFKDILDSNGTVLSILGTNLNTSSVVIFDAIRTPHMSVFDALRISCAVPLLFSAIRMNGEYFVDGAIANPFPMDVAMDTYGCTKILGLRFDTYSSNLDSNQPWKLDTFLGAVVDTLIHAASLNVPARRGVTSHVVTITTPNDVSGVNFDIPPAKKYEIFDAGAENDFRTIAEEYAEVSKQITMINKELKKLKDQKDEIGSAILAFMQTKNIDECALPGGQKIVRKVSKRTGTLKPELILEELVAQLGDEAKAHQCLQNINSKRGVVEKETITLSRGGTSAAESTS